VVFVSNDSGKSWESKDQLPIITTSLWG